MKLKFLQLIRKIKSKTRSKRNRLLLKKIKKQRKKRILMRLFARRSESLTLTATDLSIGTKSKC